MVQHERDELILRNQFDSVEHDDDFGYNDQDEVISILMLGDRNSGKTSLIYSLVHDSFNPEVPAKMADIQISADVTPLNMPLHIVDYSDHEQDRHDLEIASKNASVICIVYDSSDDEALDRITNYWIPLIQKCANVVSDESTTYKPLILVANKIDLVEDVECMMDKVTRILQECVDVEAHIETSAMNQRNVVELFATAQKAIVYPLAPLFDPRTRVLTKKCRNALINVFNQCDSDEDGLLSDHEMNTFHEFCFDVPLQPGALEDLKSIIKQSMVDGILNDSITQTGFLFIHSLSIDRGRHEFTWQVLKKFDYDNRLNARQKVNNSKLDEQHSVNSSLKDSLSHCSPANSDRKNLMSSTSSDLETELGDGDSLIKSRLDPNWLSPNSSLMKAGLGLTLATLVSMLALKFFFHNNKTFA